MKLCAQVADVLAAMCMLSVEAGHPAVLAALSESRVTYGERYRFEHLISSLSPVDQDTAEESQGTPAIEEQAGIWEYRTAAMS